MEQKMVPKEEQNNITQEDLQSYNKLKLEYQNIFKVYLDIEEEKKEHCLVLDVIDTLEPTRKCWRLVGGILVEKTCEDIKPTLKANVDMMTKATGQYSTILQSKEKEIMDFELKHGMKNDNKAVLQKPTEETKQTGILA